MARDIALARLTGGPLHLCHLSSARSVDLVRAAKAEGVRVTAEVTPHHLVFTDEDLLTYDTNLKMNPPLRSAEDRDALRAGPRRRHDRCDRHRPRAARREEKESEFDLSPPGTIGLETALAAVLTFLVEPGHRLARAGASPRMSIDAGADPGRRRPRRSDRARPSREPGACSIPAARWTVEPPFASKARNSAFMGAELTGAVVATVLHGELTVADGKAVR